MPAKGVSRVGGLGTAVVLSGAVATAAVLTSRGTSNSAAPEQPSRTAPSGSAMPSKSPTPSASPSRSAPAAVRLPPLHADFDYQIGGAYPPPAGVRIVSRDRTAAPAPGLYNICYVNAFQAQPDERASWPADLLLRDADGKVIVDEDWGEALLDIGTAAKRQRVAARVNRWIDGCAAKGFDAVEPDNYDSYTRSHGLLSANDATAFIALLSRHAHARHLAIAQKNTVELAGLRKRLGARLRGRRGVRGVRRVRGLRQGLRRPGHRHRVLRLGSAQGPFGVRQGAQHRAPGRGRVDSRQRRLRPQGAVRRP